MPGMQPAAAPAAASASTAPYFEMTRATVKEPADEKFALPKKTYLKKTHTRRSMFLSLRKQLRPMGSSCQVALSNASFTLGVPTPAMGTKVTEPRVVCFITSHEYGRKAGS